MGREDQKTKIEHVMKTERSIRKEIKLSGKVMIELIRTVHEKKKDFRFKASGNSMNPAIRNDDIITITPVRNSPLGYGEIVAFRHPGSGSLIIHRITSIKSKKYSIKGDNSDIADRNIPGENIIGVIIKVERNGKALFWPNRVNHLLFSRIYIFLIYLRLRINRILKYLVKKITQRKK